MGCYAVEMFSNVVELFTKQLQRVARWLGSDKAKNKLVTLCVD
jgi:hypothetical protein